VGFSDEIQFIVMEYIDGITLKEFIEQQGVLRWKDALHFVTQILRALQHAHDKGIVHRDIKPQNIMLFPDGTIKVMVSQDFQGSTERHFLTRLSVLFTISHLSRQGAI
jgi:serine/threonine protein kinase